VEFISQHPVLVAAVVKIAVLLFIVMTALAYLTWLERKAIAHIQSRWGPYNVGAHGLLQPLADGIKFLFKEDVTPPIADKFVYTLAPFLALALGLSAIALIPFGPISGPGSVPLFGQPAWAVTDINIGLLMLFAITSLGVYGVALAGWSSNSKYPLLGGLRSSAQMISYEVSLTMSVVGVVLVAGTLSFNELIEKQSGAFWHWNVFSFRHGGVPQIIGFLCYLTAAIAETNRVPFDLPEAENELVAGFHTEYGSMKFAAFFMAEYCNMITVCCVATLLFLGGWQPPFPAELGSGFLPAVIFLGAALISFSHAASPARPFDRYTLPVVGVVALIHAAAFGVAALFTMRPELGQGSAWLQLVAALASAVMPIFWFTAKVIVILFVYIWIRGTLPRFRYDQLMSFAWTFLFPVAIVNMFIVALVVALS
jgi:NADH-quinone oxidoreductase subunit H